MRKRTAKFRMGIKPKDKKIPHRHYVCRVTTCTVVEFRNRNTIKDVKRMGNMTYTVVTLRFRETFETACCCSVQPQWQNTLYNKRRPQPPFVKFVLCFDYQIYTSMETSAKNVCANRKSMRRVVPTLWATENPSFLPAR